MILPIINKSLGALSPPPLRANPSPPTPRKQHQKNSKSSYHQHDDHTYPPHSLSSSSSSSSSSFSSSPSLANGPCLSDRVDYCRDYIHYVHEYLFALLPPYPHSRRRSIIDHPLSPPSTRLSSFSAPYTSRNRQLVFASGAVGTASALGHVFGKPLQAKDTIPCTPANCTQLQQKEIQTMQSQSPSHTFQQQCNFHKRFRLFRQKPRQCQVHSSPSSSPNFILSPTAVHPLIVRPDKILLDEYPGDMLLNAEPLLPTMTNSTSFSSRLSSYSTASLSLSSLSYTQFSDSESCTTSSRSPRKKKKSKETQARCMCYLDTSLDQQEDVPPTTSPRTAHPSQQYFHHSSPWSWYFQKKQQKDAGRLRKIWNDSAIFQWSRPSSSSSFNRRWIHGRGESHGNSSPTPEAPGGLQHLRCSPSGTDISDEGNHSLSDDEDDASTMMVNGNRVSFQENGTGTVASRQSRHREDIMAISRYQEAIGQQRNSIDSDIYGSFPEGEMIDERTGVVPRIVNNFVNDDADDDEDDDDEDWDIQSDSGAPSSKLMYSADAREPTSFSTVTLPLSTPAPSSKSYHKKPSNANLNSLRIRQRCLSLPVDGSGPPGFVKMSSTPSENWDADFDIESADISVPSKVVENQLSLQMDIYNIKDFALQIEGNILSIVFLRHELISLGVKMVTNNSMIPLCMFFFRIIL